MKDIPQCSGRHDRLQDQALLTWGRFFIILALGFILGWNVQFIIQHWPVK
jgi:hypothetical protein